MQRSRDQFFADARAVRIGGVDQRHFEIKALFVDPRVSREIDPYALDNIFTFWTTLAPRTAFTAVRTLPPGHSLVWHDGSVTNDEWWRPTFARTDTATCGDRSVARPPRRRDADSTAIRRPGRRISQRRVGLLPDRVAHGARAE